jgi:hypothetical protein
MAYQQPGGTATFQGLDMSGAPVSAAPLSMAIIGKQGDGISRQLMEIRNSTNSNNFSLLLQGAAFGDPVDFLVRNNNFNATARTSVAYSFTDWNYVQGQTENATNRSVYLNGGNKASNTTSMTPGATGIFIILPRLGTGGSTDGAEAAIWDTHLNDDEVASLGKGFKPHRIRPQSLVFYAPLIRELQDVARGRAIANNGGLTVLEHPRVY